jgi:succinate dehydrogenase flavin-adding protein (antitoxin of CptAB toxin-antitoxin module)
LDRTRLARLRWRARRGLLENDLVLERFLAARGDALTEDEAATLDRLLDMTDNDLWDLIAGRAETEDPALRPLVQALRDA